MSAGVSGRSTQGPLTPPSASAPSADRADPETTMSAPAMVSAVRCSAPMKPGDTCAMTRMPARVKIGESAITALTRDTSQWSSDSANAP